MSGGVSLMIQAGVHLDHYSKIPHPKISHVYLESCKYHFSRPSKNSVHFYLNLTVSSMDSCVTPDKVINESLQMFVGR